MTNPILNNPSHHHSTVFQPINTKHRTTTAHKQHSGQNRAFGQMDASHLKAMEQSLIQM